MRSLVMIAALASLLAACGTPKKVVVTGCAAPPEPVLTSALTYEQLREVARRLAADCLRRPWLAEYVKQFKRKPVVRLRPLQHNERHLVDLRQMGSLLERELMPRMTVVASIEDAQEVRRIREYEAGHAADAEARMENNETGAEYLLTGSLREVESAVPGGTARAYVFTLELLDIGDNSKVWVGKHTEKLLIKSKEPAADICR